MAVIKSVPPPITCCSCGRKFEQTMVITRARQMSASSRDRGRDPLTSRARLDLLPTELLYIILDKAFELSTASRGLCCCSRPQTSYEALGRISFAHRIVDSFAVRSTCSKFHAWALYRIVHPDQRDRLEIDFSDIAALAYRLRTRTRHVLRRLCRDFPSIARESLIMYLGNPGHMPNIRLVLDMLHHQCVSIAARSIVGGVSFWNLRYSVKGPRRSMVLDIISTGVFGPIFVMNTPAPDGDLALNPKIVKRLSAVWLREQQDDLQTHFSLQAAILRSVSRMPYMQVPAVVLQVGTASAWDIFTSLTQICEHLVVREFAGLDHGHMNDFCHDLFGLVDRCHSFKRTDTRVQHALWIAFQTFERQMRRKPLVIPSAGSSKTRSARQRDGLCRKFDVLLKSVDDEPLRPWPYVDDNILNLLSGSMFKNLTAVEISGGNSLNITIYGLLTKLLPVSKTLRGFTYTPKTHAVNEAPQHHCPLLKKFPALVNVVLDCHFCPEALNVHESIQSAPQLRRQWIVDSRNRLPCEAWRKCDSEKQRSSRELSALEMLLDAYRSAWKSSAEPPVRNMHKLDGFAPKDSVSNSTGTEMDFELYLVVARWQIRPAPSGK